MTQKFEDVFAGFLKAAAQNNLSQEQAIELYKTAMHKGMVPAPAVETPKVDEKQAAYVTSFVKRASEYGMPQEQAITILKQANPLADISSMFENMDPRTKMRLLTGIGGVGVGGTIGALSAEEGHKGKGALMGAGIGGASALGINEIIQHLMAQSGGAADSESLESLRAKALAEGGVSTVPQVNRGRGGIGSAERARQHENIAAGHAASKAGSGLWNNYVKEQADTNDGIVRAIGDAYDAVTGHKK